MYGIIYLTTNKINGKKYIGMCKNTHSRLYLGSGKLFKQALKKYGKENFERTVLQECETFEELSRAEEYWIKQYGAVESQDFYNLTSGGFGGNSDYMKEYWTLFTKDERKKLRNWQRRSMIGENNPMYGKKHSEETKKKISNKLKGKSGYWKNKKLSISTKQKLSEIGKTLIGDKNPFFGKKHSEETKRKISNSKKHNLINKKSL